MEKDKKHASQVERKNLAFLRIEAKLDRVNLKLVHLLRRANRLCVSLGASLQGQRQVHLIVQYFSHKSPERQKELDYCLRRNLLNLAFTRVHLLVEDNIDLTKRGFTPLALKRCNILNISRRLTYGFAFRWASMHLPFAAKVVVANADIYFQEEGIRRIAETNMEGKCYCLLRWETWPKIEIFSGKRGPRKDSQDAWIFQVPFYVPKAEFFMGLPGCDNRIAFLISKQGYVVSNPCYEIKSFHVHKDNPNKYSTHKGHKEGRQKVKGSYLLVPPTKPASK
ncbi:hypothetical protein AAMO2058_000979200 [Amorphochlora amoebiformis]